MDLPELSELRTRIETEIGTRYGEDWVRIGQGTIVAGKNIPVGTYEIICTEPVVLYEVPIFSLYVFESIEKSKVQTNAIWFSSYNKAGTSFTVSLEEGNVLELAGGSGIIRKAPSFFMP